MLLFPVRFFLTKSSTAAIQSVLHVLFLPTPFKLGSSSKPLDPETKSQEVLKPGALYADCAAVRLRIETPSTPVPQDSAGTEGHAETGRDGWEEFDVLML